MTILALSTSADVASAALLKDGVLLAEKSADPARRHAETALTLMRELLEESGLAIDCIDAFAVDVGPGSFTGLRIGVCAVNALAFARNRPVIAVDSLRALAEPHIGERGRTLALIDAGHGESYSAMYEGELCVMEPGARATESLLRGLPADTFVARDLMPRASWVALAAWRMNERAAASAAPLYIQIPQAERQYRARMKALEP